MMSEQSARLAAIDAMLVRRLHGDFPLTDTPFADIGRELGLEESEVIARLQSMLAQGLLSRFGPLFQIERAGGQFVLAAMQVPQERFDAVASQVNALPEVAHNYRREHPFNMWFVVAVERPEGIGEVLAAIERETGYRAIDLPKQREYYLRLKLDAGAAR